jgi:hypothetical protein
MPPALLLGAVATAALSTGLAVATATATTTFLGMAVLGWGAAAMFGAYLVGTLALGMLSQALAGKPKQPSLMSPAGEAQARTQMVRSPIMNRRIVVGRAVVSGPIAFAATHPGNSPPSGPANSNLTLVIVLAAHKVSYIGEVFLNDTPASDPRFAGHVTIYRFLGSDDQSASARLLELNVGWTNAHRLRGLAYIEVELKWDPEVFPTGMPNVKAEVWGLECYDPRTGGTGFTNNVALVTRAYLRNQDWGLHAAQDEVDDLDGFIPSADICDEYVEVVEDLRSFFVSPYELPQQIIFIDEPRFAVGIGDRVRVEAAAGSVLPAPLLIETDYYVIPTEYRYPATRGWSNGIMLAASLAGARSRTGIHLTTYGSGPAASLFIVRIAQPRYTANGVIDCGKTPKAIIDEIMSADAGICVWEAGLYRHFAGAARPSTFVLTQSDLRGPLGVAPTIDKQRLCNQVYGTYVSPVDNWQPADFDGVTNALYLAEDLGEPIRRDIELGYTTDAIAAQRIAKMHLEATRQGAQLSFPAKTIGLGISIWDVGQIYIPMLGYDGKQFQCVGWRFSDDAGFDLDLREYADAIYAWNKGEETIRDPAPDTILPKPWQVAPTAITGFHEELVETRAGAGVAAALTVFWAAANDAFVVAYDLQFRQVPQTDWRPLPRVGGLQTTIVDIPAGPYEFRVRAANSLGVTSAWSPIAFCEVIGLTAQPEDITGFMLQPRGRQGHLRWDLHPALDVRIGGRIRLRWSPDTEGAAWEETVPLLPGEPAGVAGSASEATVPLLIGTYFAKAVDSSGNLSPNAVRVINFTPADLFDSPSIDTLIFEPAWDGTFVNTSAPDGALTLDSATLVDDLGMVDDVPLWDAGSTGVALSGTWRYGETLDLGAVYGVTLTALLRVLIYNTADLIDARVTDIDDWDDFDGVPVGALANAYMQVRVTEDDPFGADPAWQPWTSFLALDCKARGLEFQVALDTLDPQYAPRVDQAHVTLDMADRTESGVAVSSAAGDTTVSFAHRFFSAPRIGGQVQGAAADDQFVMISKTALGFVFKIVNGAGVRQVRTLDWQAAGQGYGGF